MSFLFDLFPLVVFFIAFKSYGIMQATKAIIVASAIQIAYWYFRTGRVPKMQLFSFITVLLLGSATILLDNEMFVKWKPTIVYWLLGLILLIGQVCFEKIMIQNIAPSNFTLTDKIWRQLNSAWTFFFFIMGAINIYVVYNFDTTTWVKYKVIGNSIISLLFVIAQGIYIAKNNQEQEIKVNEFDRKS